MVDEHKNGASKLWFVGVILSILGSVMTNMGVNLQKYSFMKEAKRSVRDKRNYFRQPFWVFGMSGQFASPPPFHPYSRPRKEGQAVHSRGVCMCVRPALGLACVIGGSGLDFVALGFMPQSLATPVGGSTMVANVAFASLFLKEKFSRRVRSRLRLRAHGSTGRDPVDRAPVAYMNLFLAMY